MNRVFQAGKTQNSLTDIVFPSSIQWSYNEISSEKSGRAKSGKMNKKIIASKRKLECSWSMLDDDASSKLLKSIKPFTYIYLKFPDPFEGKDITKRFYTDDAVADSNIKLDGKYIWNVSFSFIEQ